MMGGGGWEGKGDEETSLFLSVYKPGKIQLTANSDKAYLQSLCVEQMTETS